MRPAAAAHLDDTGPAARLLQEWPVRAGDKAFGRAAREFAQQAITREMGPDGKFLAHFTHDHPRPEQVATLLRKFLERRGQRPYPLQRLRGKTPRLWPSWARLADQRCRGSGRESGP